MKPQKRTKRIVLIVAIIVVLIFAVLPFLYQHLFMAEMKQAIKTSKTSYSKRASELPKIDHKLTLYSEGKIELSQEEHHLLEDIWYEEMENGIEDWFLSEITKAIKKQTLYYQDYARNNPDNAKKLISWTKGEKELSLQEITKLLDEYYGYIHLPLKSEDK